MRAVILVVEDERSLREFLEILLKRNDYEVLVASNGKEAINLLAHQEVDLILSDLKMPEMGGLDLLKYTKKDYPNIEVLMMTAFASTQTAIAAMKVGAYDYLTKPFKVDEVLATVDRALEKRALVRENVALREQLSDRHRTGDLLGKSSAMQRVFERLRKVAKTKTSVLITGESGTGKELVARAVHELSERSEKPFIPVNCGAIPDALMESELFGHIRGAFSGATTNKEGLFAAADGGTLFLDEIAELGPAMQVKLLRALQERRIKPVGGVDEEAVDVRVLAATNRDLDEEIKAERFRADLFYRLNVIPVYVPPLRERRDDIRMLVEHFVRKFSIAAGVPEPLIAPEAMALLCQYHYPGNVRELENLVERAVTLSNDSRIDTSALPELHTRYRASPRLADRGELPVQGLDLDAHMGAIEQHLLKEALGRTAGSRSEAAKLVGLSLRSLRYRLAKYGISVDDTAPE